MPSPDHPHPGQGVALAILATACFALLDTLSQFVGSAVPVLMAIWTRFLVQTGMTVGLLLPRQGRSLFATRAPGWQLLRGALMTTSGVGAYLSLQHVPVGEFTAILMLVPLAVTLLAAVLLRERVSALTWALVAGGLTGALIIVRPKGSDLNLGMFLPLVLVVINACYQIVTSRMVKTEDPATMHFYTGLFGLAIASLALPWSWARLPTPGLWLLVALLGVFGSLGHYFMIKAYQKAPASRITPYMYSQIGFATLAGWIVFGHAPDVWTVLGIALVAVCGVLGVRAR
ncbi:DMT family transporter [Hydrogenophaga electricum]|uniref:DMT transporter permease n=1 Tax=Hydrogenophaga electricum TaxID=1230953 RepID=A0ABQ6C845_9BURK|nr:DMT family transporter [Hydrogenophaga electricum]GLS15979.1 DMT transporter permease [Hydrogenophaga electricum]